MVLPRLSASLRGSTRKGTKAAFGGHETVPCLPWSNTPPHFRGPRSGLSCPFVFGRQAIGRDSGGFVETARPSPDTPHQTPSTRHPAPGTLPPCRPKAASVPSVANLTPAVGEGRMEGAKPRPFGGAVAGASPLGVSLFPSRARHPNGFIESPARLHRPPVADCCQLMRFRPCCGKTERVEYLP